MQMKTTEIGNKVLVLGSCGAGKSTFARKLHERTGLPLVHLDLVWWRPDATHISREEFDRRLEAILSGDRWIIDGDYRRTYEPRIRACDTVIFLDYDEESCLRGLRQRVGEKRPDIPWVEQKLEPELVELVSRYRADSRPKLLALLAQYPEKGTVIFRTREEAEAWLQGIKRAALAAPHEER